ncbi:MAG: glucokinase [Planctomycetes bacterium]|nr:glucokinase [Planctomycetota bacterium]
MLVLAGDVGGTNARLALIDVDGDRATLRARAQVAVAEQAGLEGPVASFLAVHLGGAPAPRACIGVAGTIIGRAASVAGVNMPWTVDAEALERACGLPRVGLINDFYAAARGVELLGPEDVQPVGPSEGRHAEPGHPVAILGAGTGLGQAFSLALPDDRRLIVPTEGGHRDFAPCDPLQDRLLVWLRQRHGRVSTERVLSGPGLVATYRFLVDAEGRPACPEVEGAAPAEQGPRITARALGGAGAGHPTCVAALETFVDVYGAEAGNVALTVLATGGVYLAGGIAPSILTRPDLAERFRRAFDAKGRLRDLLDRIPVWVITNPDLGLLGAAREAMV